MPRQLLEKSHSARCGAGSLLGSVRTEERPALSLIGNMSGQYQTQFGQGFEFCKLSLHQNSGNRANVTSEIRLDCDNACRVRGVYWLVAFLLGRFDYCRPGS